MSNSGKEPELHQVTDRSKRSPIPDQWDPRVGPGGTQHFTTHTHTHQSPSTFSEHTLTREEERLPRHLRIFGHT